MRLLGDLPLRGAARLREGGSSFWGDLPLRGAAGLEEGICGFWGISGCAGLLD